jgi:flagellar motor switch protein FliN
MTEAAAPAPQPGPAEYVQLWSESLSQVLGQITGSPAPCVARQENPADLTPPGESDLCAVVTASGGLRGEMSLRLTSAAVLRLAQIFTSEPPTPESQPTADHRDAVIELLRQVSGIVSTAAKGCWGEIQLLVEAAPAAPSWPAAGRFIVEAGDGVPSGIAIEFILSAALVAELRVEKVDPVNAEPAKAETEPSRPIPLPADSGVGAGSGALDRLMDVQLAVTMRFGAKTLLLREVLELSPGSVIELDRKVQEPVDLLLDGRLVARGEVVVIEGNYGLRVTDVSPMDAG